MPTDRKDALLKVRDMAKKMLTVNLEAVKEGSEIQKEKKEKSTG